MSLRRHLLALCLVALGAVSALVVRAETTSGFVITACVAPSGSLRIVSDPGACRPPEWPLSWGEGGLSDYQIVQKDYFFQPNTSSAFGTQSVQCPVGMKVLGGGAAALADDFNGGVSIIHTTALTFDAGSYPSASDTWTVAYSLSNGLFAVGIRIFATCAS